MDQRLEEEQRMYYYKDLICEAGKQLEFILDYFILSIVKYSFFKKALKGCYDN